MKFNVCIEIDWIDEEANLDDSIREQVISCVSRDIAAHANKNLEGLVSQVNARADECIALANARADDLMAEYLKDFTAREIVITDEWGHVKKKSTIEELICARIDEALNVKVNNDGRIDGYRSNTNIVEYFTKMYAEKEIAKRFEAIRKEIESSLDKAIHDKAKNMISSALIQHVDIAAIQAAAREGLAKEG